MREKIPTTEFVTLFEQLANAGFKRPDIPQDVLVLAEAYRTVLGHHSLEALQDAVRRWCAVEERFWPKPAALNRLAKEFTAGPKTPAGDLRAQYLAWENRGGRDELDQLSPCPVCDAVLEPAGRIMVHHDRQRHQEARVPTLTYA